MSTDHKYSECAACTLCAICGSGCRKEHKKVPEGYVLCSENCGRYTKQYHNDDTTCNHCMMGKFGHYKLEDLDKQFGPDWEPEGFES